MIVNKNWKKNRDGVSFEAFLELIYIPPHVARLRHALCIFAKKLLFHRLENAKCIRIRTWQQMWWIYSTQYSFNDNLIGEDSR